MDTTLTIYKYKFDKENVGYIFRRVIFYLFLLNFCSMTVKYPFLTGNLTFWFLLIHALYFEIDLRIPQNNFLVILLHSLSFCGAFLVAILATVLVAILNPNFIEERSKQENVSIGTSIFGHIWLHYLPVVYVLIDFYLHKHLLFERHQLSSIITNLRPSSFNIRALSWRDYLKTLFYIIGAPLVCFIWLLCGYTTEKVYGAKDNPYITYPCALLSQLLIVWLGFYLFSKHEYVVSTAYASINHPEDNNAEI